MIRPASAPLNAVQIEASISDTRLQIGALQRRLPDLDEAIEATRALLGEAEQRLQRQESEVARTQLATGRSMTFGRPDQQRTVTYTNGRGTVQLDGPAPADSPKGKAEAARRLYDALSAEIAPIRSALISLEKERADAMKGIGLLEGEIQHHERQLGDLHNAEHQRAQLLGRLDWSQRLSAILRKLGGRAA